MKILTSQSFGIIVGGAHISYAPPFSTRFHGSRVCGLQVVLGDGAFLLWGRHLFLIFYLDMFLIVLYCGIAMLDYDSIQNSLSERKSPRTLLLGLESQ